MKTSLLSACLSKAIFTRRICNCYVQAQRFLVTLSTEVATRLQTAGTKGRTITVKVQTLASV